MNDSLDHFPLNALGQFLDNFMKRKYDLIDGGTLQIIETAINVVAIIKDKKGELHVAFSTDGDGVPSVDISGPEGTPIAVEEYDTVSQTTMPIKSNEFGCAFHKPDGPIHVTLYERT